jgi:hypothetical protein
MPTKFLSVTQTVDELERQFGIRVNPQTVRIWCRRFGFGVRLAPNGRYHVPESRLQALADAGIRSEGASVA